MKKSILFFALIFILGRTKAQNALNFDGVDDFVQTNFQGVLASGDRTFEAWVNVSPSAPSSNLTILDYGVNAAGSRNTFIIDGVRTLRFISGGTNANLPASSSTITPGQWVHVAFVLDNGTGYTYINGIQASTGNLSNVNTPSGNQNVKIGQRVSGGSIPFSGSIDEVRIWNVARTAAEIAADMNSELCSHPSSLVAYYKLNQGISAGNNSGLTNVVGELGDTAIANNFSMIGSTSNWISGASINSVTPFDLGLSLDTLSQLLTANDTSTNVHYQWYDCTNDSILLNDTNRTFYSRAGGTFAVILTSGNCIDTSVCMMTNIIVAPPAPGEALSFDGVDDFVQTTFSGILDSANRTFEAWIKVDQNAPSSNLAILDYGLNTVGSRNTFMVNGSRGVTYISGGTNANFGTGAGIIQAGQWTHVAFVLNNGTGYIYVNGIQEGTGNLSSVNTPSGNGDLIIGQRVSGGSIPFAGEIDELRIWDVARTQAEIVANMNFEYCVPVSGLAAYYNMDNGIASGNNSNLTKVFNPINSGDGFLNNFALTGSTSNFVAPGATIGFPTIDSTVTQMGATLVANDSTADSFQWYDCSNNQNLLNDTMRSFTAFVNGDYSVIITRNACSDTSACINVTSVGIDQTTFKNSFYLSQNPVRDLFYLLNNSEIKVKATVRSITGRIIERKPINSNSKLAFNLTKEASGIYFLTVESIDGYRANYKVIKQ